VYDDADLFAALLRDLVATAAAGGAAADSARLGAALAHSDAVAAALLDAQRAQAASRAAAAAARPAVDRRATKGRVLKYKPIPALVHFAAPTPYVVPPDKHIDLDLLIASLFKSQA